MEDGVSNRRISFHSSESKMIEMSKHEIKRIPKNHKKNQRLIKRIIKRIPKNH